MIVAFIARMSSAVEASCHSACIELWDPVCASDGATYGNTCFFEYEQCVRRLAEGAEYVEAAVLYLGECRGKLFLPYFVELNRAEMFLR